MKLTHKTISRAAAALSLTVAGAVFSQTSAPWSIGGMMGMGPGMMGPGMMGPGVSHEMGEADMASHHAAELKAKLKIIPAQEAAWKAFEAAIQQQASTLQAMRSQMLNQQQLGAGGTDWAAQRNALINQIHSGRAAQAAALRELYAVLTPEQRAIVDRNAMGVGWQPPCFARAS